MRWSYKTVLFELKKDGILGSSFLDETELEQSLNEYGIAGWELISLLEIKDGIIAVFKQALSASARDESDAASTVEPAVTTIAGVATRPAAVTSAYIVKKDSQTGAGPETLQPIFASEPENKKDNAPAERALQPKRSMRGEDQENPATSDLGSIRIE